MDSGSAPSQPCSPRASTADGEPTALEEEIRWLVNRGRFDSARENQTWSTSYTDIPATAAPLAPHYAITLACRHHSEDMARNNLFRHATIPGSAYYDPVTQPTPWDRMKAEGYNYSSAAENIAPVLSVIQLPQEIQLRWPSQAGAQYLPQATSDWSQWTNLSPAPLIGTGGELSVATGLPTPDQPRRYFRVLAQ